MPNGVALYFDTAGYTETLNRRGPTGTNEPVGLMGRQVAGKEFLTAFLSHSTCTGLTVVVRDRANAEAWKQFYEEHPASQSKPRRWQVVDQRRFTSTLVGEVLASPLYFPNPPDVRFVWARQQTGPGSFAVCGVTHTLSSQVAIASLCDLVVAPYEPFDCLICTSRAVVNLVQSVVTTYSDYLRDRFGGEPRSRARLELVPLGVDAEKYRPATAEERNAQRRALDIADDEVAVLFMGRLSFHAKAHPFPMFQGLAQAAQSTGQKVHLILSGWAANDSILKAFVEGARELAPGIRIAIVDGTQPRWRLAVWQAADVFTSLSDNIQETFGLVIIEAMACGLPVVATDWNGYRDLVVDGETGYLVPTLMVEDATAQSTTRLLMGEVNYDHYLAECSQAAAVDVAAAAAAYGRLLLDTQLRQRMGETGRRRVLDHFAWSRVIPAYEAIWQAQETERNAFQASAPRRHGPANFPAPEIAFAGYPTLWLKGSDRLEAVPEAETRLAMLLRLPLTCYMPSVRCSEGSLIQKVLRAAATPCAIAELDAIFQQAGGSNQAGRATLAWLLKYGLLRQMALSADP